MQVFIKNLSCWLINFCHNFLLVLLLLNLSSRCVTDYGAKIFQNKKEQCWTFLSPLQKEKALVFSRLQGLFV